MLSLKVLFVAAQIVLPMAEFDAIDEPIWCAETKGLVAQIRSLGGHAVKRRYDGNGRSVEWFWNDSEEVVVEHNPGGDSCLVRMRTPGW